MQVPFYVLGQLIGGLLGALAARHIYDVSLELVLTAPQSTIAKCFAAEFIAAMQFMMLACSVSTDGHVVI
jgi:glycerol uptake facilitator-like aquaporin